jgi:glutaredoxin
MGMVREIRSPGEWLTGVTYLTDWCGACHRAKRVFASLGVPYTYVNIEEDTAAA